MEKSKIEWCDSTWNPVSGCYHPCPYCYARSTANRFKGCDCAAGGETDENVVYLKERLTVTSKDGVTRNAAYPFGFIPDTLCQCVFALLGGECGVMGWIKTTKDKQQDRKWAEEDRQRMEREAQQPAQDFEPSFTAEQKNRDQ